MHQLHLLRHAKSSWDDDADDHERPLNKRGREAARLIGEGLPRAVGSLDLVLCSSALSIHARPVARFLGITHVLCNHFTVDDAGLLTGNIVRPIVWGPTKAAAVQTFAPTTR